jgi:hypothetical protein
MGVGEIFVARLGTFEGHDETVGIAFVEALGGIIGTVVEIEQAGD